MQLKLYSKTPDYKSFEYDASIRRTYILVYETKNVTVGGLIGGETKEGLYTFIANKDFKLKYRQDLNVQFLIIGQDLNYFANVGFCNRMKLYFFHKRLWVQKEENIRWLMNVIIAIVATYAAFKIR